jgi:hypothetical protein
MPRIAVAAILVAVLLAGTPGATYADTCRPEAFRLDDMAGTYINPESPMRVEVYPCGGVYLQWDNVYGTHRAIYYGTRRSTGGGFAAEGVRAEPAGVFLDDSFRMGIKPAEPGFVQIVTLGVYDETFRVYRLKKIT